MSLKTPSLLITDDDRGIRETLRDVFQPRGFQTFLAADGEEALDIVHHEEIHLVLIDMHMPKLSGLETIRRVKQIRAVLPWILISAALDEAIAQEAREIDVFGVLAKPIRCAEITRIVGQAMQTIYGWPNAG